MKSFLHCSSNFWQITLDLLRLPASDRTLIFKQNLPGADDLPFIAGAMEQCALQSKSKTPVYTIFVSWDLGEAVSGEEMVELAQNLLKDLGVTEHQAIAVRLGHPDDPYPALYILFNRVHPRHGKRRPDGKKIRVWWKGDYHQKYMRNILLRNLNQIAQQYGWCKPREDAGDVGRLRGCRNLVHYWMLYSYDWQPFSF
ncbi:MAG: relaxase/mobilization nuclease domain-containing protein [Rhodothermaceae bacterium]|nr:relaxase/mobilization nuclease domain-containing protein [Rhodothermaceae bacterium]MYD66826.1 relaxase/mobilization nuclease domain-containing protein [Rhodothermaceae bacterium]MYJ08407.1 relaxase/mobilization nuclease domain-containing protein [Rhodothermaceae bacterium]